MKLDVRDPVRDNSLQRQNIEDPEVNLLIQIIGAQQKKIFDLMNDNRILSGVNDNLVDQLNRLWNENTMLDYEVRKFLGMKQSVNA